MRVSVVQVFQDGFLVRHRYAEPVNGNFAHAGEQVGKRFGMKSQVDGIDVFPAHRCVHDGRGKRVRNRITDHTIDAGSSIDLFDTVRVAQFLCGHLAGAGFFSRICRGEGEYAAGSNTQDPADDALFSHAQAYDGMLIAVLFKKPHHGDVVSQGGGRSCHFIEVSGNSSHLLERLLQLLGSSEVVIGEDERSPSS